MANWIPNPTHLDVFKSAVAGLMLNRVCTMEKGFPLNFEQVMLVTTPPELADLLALGLDSLRTTKIICFEVGPDQGATRRAIVKVYLPKEVHHGFARQITGRYKEDSPIYFNNKLDPRVHQELIKWVDRSVYERRLARLVGLTVADFLTHIPKISIYHIAARWPALKVIFPRATVGYGRHSDIWKKHGNELGRNLRRWEWPVWGEEAEWYAQNARKMRLCEEAILSAVTLPAAEHDPRPVYGEISDWEKKNGQIV